MGGLKRIVCDLDGVIVEWCRPFHALLTSLGATMRPFDQIDPDCWDWFTHYGAEQTQIGLATAYTKRTPQWWGDLPPHRDFMRDAREKLWDLEQDHEVTYVTCRPCGRDATAEWLKFYLPSVNPYVVLTPGNKVMALVAMQPDVIIEDCLATLQAYKRVVATDNRQPPTQLILVDRAYNRVGDREGLTVVKSTGEGLEVAHVCQ